jgi:hypothetical protein
MVVPSIDHQRVLDKSAFSVLCILLPLQWSQEVAHDEQKKLYAFPP